MSPRDRLRSLRNFADLIRYLEDELAWPLQQYGFEELTFAYEADELGLREEDAAKVKKIHQLRPLASGQPWGIFFIEFEKKRLPVVVLRRILSLLVIKKRASANKSERAAWQPEDLLFVSAFGDEGTDQREIAFAHFHQESGDLPTLRVLGWDGGDTPLKLEHVDATLHDKLRWPADPRDLSGWRAQWTRAFRHRIGHVIRTADGLAERLASLARGIRGAAQTMMAHESERGPLTKLYKAFQTALIHDLTPESFADTYAQTITYGLLTAAISRTEMSAGTAGTFVRAEDISDIVPVTNPFLKEMLQTFLKAGGRKGGIDFDELGIQDVVEFLRGDETDLPAILRDFGNKNPDEDPVIHFYEHFLSAYNKQLKIQRGVFYTPPPVVSYIVRSVHELLQTEFGLEDGLASTVTWGEMVERSRSRGRQSAPSKGSGESAPTNVGGYKELKLPPLTDEPGEKRTIDSTEPFVQILDIATGTATFIVEVIDVIHRHLKAQWEKGGLPAMPALRSADFQSAVSPVINRQGVDSSERVGKGAASSGLQTRDTADYKSALRGIRTFQDYWNAYVPACLLPRLYGFELMMAPYAIAHMKVGLKLYETGYRFGSTERVRIYLTNTLEPKVRQLPQIGFDALAHEAAAVNEIKWYKRFTVLVGNPPYSINSCNLQESAVALVDPFRYVDGEKIQERGALKFETILQDDYLKFWGFGLRTLAKTPSGIISMISNNGFFTNRVLRGVRKTLLNSFGRLAFFDLHGNRSKGEVCPDGTPDDNVFDINQGVGISILRKISARPARNQVELADLRGSRDSKYRTLGSSTASQTAFNAHIPKPPYYAFAQVDEDVEDEYRSFTALDEAMPFNKAGFVSGRDDFAVDFEIDPLEQRISDFLNPKNGESIVRERYSIKDAGGYELAKRRQPALAAKLEAKDIIRRVQHRPFDYRFVAYSEAVLTSPQKAAMHQLLAGDNMAFCLSRGAEIIRGWEHIFCTRAIIQHHTVSLKEVNYVFPLNVRVEDGSLALGATLSPNFAPHFVKSLTTRLKLSFDATSRFPKDLTPEDIFHYAYAVFHSPGYRSRYAEFLKIDFPRLPLTSSLDLFRALARLGGELVALHLLESPKLEKPITRFIGPASPVVEKVSFVGRVPSHGGLGPKPPPAEGSGPTTGTVWLDKAQTTGFKGVPDPVWNFHIGGYQVCEKWLKDRKGRALSADDLAHYQKIVVALAETIRLMAEIDAVIVQHGGWPMK